jgi:hypothetical protein
MKKYEYQLLRFVPDRVTKEFANVGIVVYSGEDLYLNFAFNKKVSRITDFFCGLNLHPVINSIRELEYSLKIIQKQLHSDQRNFITPRNVNEITSSILAPNDSALMFSEVFRAIDINLDSAFLDLKDRLVLKYEKIKEQEEIASDEDVWDVFFKPKLQERNILQKLHPKTFNTSIDQLTFNFAWKNEKWHCYQPVNFNLKRPESIKEKAYKWSGKIQWLASSDEELQINFLTVFPKQTNLKEFIRKVLLHNEKDSLRLNFITPEEGNYFIDILQKEMDSHLEFS